MEAGPPGGPQWPGEARVTFEWLEGRAFLIERWTVELPEAPDGMAIPQRFTGAFSDDGKTIAGRWEKAEDGSGWETDFDLTYRKVS